MTIKPLSAQIADTLAELQVLEQAHAVAEEYEQACERLKFVHERVRLLYLELLLLKFAARVLNAIYASNSGNLSLERTHRELRRLVPKGMELPSRALVGGGLDLLRMVDYTGAATSLVRARRMLVCEELSVRAAGAEGDPGYVGSRAIAELVLGEELVPALALLANEESSEAQTLLGLAT